MKNCPRFSLRSNSIESRFRSIPGAIFGLMFFVNFLKAKATRNSLRSLAVFARFARSRLNCLYEVKSLLG